MVYGAIRYMGIRILDNFGGTMALENYIDTLRHKMLPLDYDHLRQQDNAPCHKSRAIMHILKLRV